MRERERERERESTGGLVCLLVCLHRVYRPTREYSTHMKTSPLPGQGL